MNPKKRLGEMLMEAGIIDETQLKAALGHQRQWGVRLGQALVDLKLATEADIVRALSLKFGFGVAQIGQLEPYALEQALKLLPREFAARNNVFPMGADTASITVAMSDPTNLAVVDEIRFRTGRRVKVCMGGDREVADAVKRHYPAEETVVEAIALDLDADDGQSEAVFDPFGGGSKDALEAFFGQQPEAPAPAAPNAPAASAAPVAAPAAVAPPAAAPAPAAVARPRAAPPPPAPPQPAAAPARAPAPAPAPARPAPAPRPTAVAPAPRPPAPVAGPLAAPAPTQTRPAMARVSAPAPAAPTPAVAPPPALARPAAANPNNARPVATAAAAPARAPGAAASSAVKSAAPPPPAAARQVAPTGSPAAPAAKPAAPPAPAPTARRPVELELEEPAPSASAPDVRAAPAQGAPVLDVAPTGIAPFPEDLPGGEPILATDLAPEEELVEGRPSSSRPLTSEEIAILDALERLAAGHHAEPDIVKPAQAMAALVRLLLRRRIITEQEFLDELTKK